MKVRKTSSKKRSTYVYEFGTGEKYEVKPGEGGVTEAHIKLVHALDDSEVYNNTKNMHPKRTKEEKELISQYKEKCIEQFKKEYGFEPCSSYIEDMVKEAYPTNWNLSIDWDFGDGGDVDKSHVSFATSVTMETSNPETDRLYEVIGAMTDKQQQVLRMVEFEGYTLTQVAEMMGTSVANVSKHYKKAIEYIKNNYYEK